MLTAPRRRWAAAALVAATAGAMLGGAAPASAHPVGAVVPRVPAEIRASAGPGDGVPNPISELPATPSPGGPLTPADRDFVVKVRLAGLWERPASDMAVRKGSSPRVREIGVSIAAQHKKLDELDVRAAKQLGIPLPNEPNTDQQSWLGEMQRASGQDFDHVYVDRLRAAHGKIFPAIANIRSGTRNDIVRELAAQANAFVLTHMTLLESTGLVAYNALPQPPPPAPAAAAAQAVGDGTLLGGLGTRGGVSPTVVWIVLAAALIAGVFSMVRLIRPR